MRRILALIITAFQLMTLATVAEPRPPAARIERAAALPQPSLSLSEEMAVIAPAAAWEPWEYPLSYLGRAVIPELSVPPVTPPLLDCTNGNLSQCVSSLAPGTWGELLTFTGTTEPMFFPTVGESGFTYSNDGGWDPVHHYGLLYFTAHVGGSCGPVVDPACANESQSFVKYDEATNSFSQLPNAGQGLGSGGHTYDEFSINTFTGDAYKMYGTASTVFKAYDRASNTWSNKDQNNDSPMNCTSGNYQGTTWWPDYNSGTGGVLSGCVINTMGVWNPSNNTWANSGLTGDYGVGGNTVAVYNPVTHHVLVGGGAHGCGDYPSGPCFLSAKYRNFHILSVSGTTVSFVSPNTRSVSMNFKPCYAANPVPANDILVFFDGGGSKGYITVDPASGRYIMFTREADCSKSMYEYNETTDVWNQLTGDRVPFEGGSQVVPSNLTVGSDSSGDSFECVPLIEHGAIACLAEMGVAPWVHFYVYKHATVNPPSAPTGCASKATTAISDEIKCTAASAGDNAVAGYRIFANGAQCGSITGNYPIVNCTGLSANTSYMLTVAAVDTAGFRGPSSSGVSITTDAALLTHAQKCAQTGVLHCENFDSQSNLHYWWPTSDSGDSSFYYAHHICDAALGPGGTSPLAPQTFYVKPPFTSGSYAAVGNVEAVAINGQCNYPYIDTSIKQAGAGSIKFPIPTHSGATLGEFYGQFKHYNDDTFGYVGPTTSVPDAMAHHEGNDLWFQIYERIPSSLLSQVFTVDARQSSFYGHPPYTFHTLSAGATTVIGDNCPAGGYVIEDTMIGQSVWFQGGDGFTNWQSFLITGITSDRCGLILSTSPTPTMAGGAPPYTENTQPEALGYLSSAIRGSGFKSVGIFGSQTLGGTPTAGTSGYGSAQLLFMGDKQANLPSVYSYEANNISDYPASTGGYQAIRNCANLAAVPAYVYAEPPCLIWHPDTWHEITVHLQQHATSNPVTTFVCDDTGLYEMWIDGKKAQEFNTYGSCWGTGYTNGTGQFNISPYHTAKDPNQDHTPTFVNFDSFIVSTQPIPMLSADNPVFVITTSSPLPDGTQGTAYSQTINASDGTTPYSFAVTVGSLPSGLSLASGGALTGTPSASGDSSFTITATDSTSPTPNTAPKAFTLHIASAGDTTNPTVAITVPSNNTTFDDRTVRYLNGTATASDNVGVVGVQFKIDGVNVGAEDTSSPYNLVNFNLRGIKTGDHTFTAVARDAAGNTGTSSITIKVKHRSLWSIFRPGGN